MISDFAAERRAPSSVGYGLGQFRLVMVDRERHCIARRDGWPRANPRRSNWVALGRNKSVAQASEPVSFRRRTERLRFQRFARVCRYLRTVCSTLVTRRGALGRAFAEQVHQVVVKLSPPTVYRHPLQLPFRSIPEKPHKTQRNREIRVERPVGPVEICS